LAIIVGVLFLLVLALPIGLWDWWTITSFHRWVRVGGSDHFQRAVDLSV
jgi:hypothetical protein